MTNEIPKFKIGIGLDAVKKFAMKEENGLNEQQKNSIFNFIDEDTDGKITNAGELQIIQNILKGTKNMPPQITIDEGEYRELENGFEVSRKTYDLNESTVYENGKKHPSEYRTFDTTYFNEEKYGNPEVDKIWMDIYNDTNNDGLMDNRRQITETSDGLKKILYDDNADGSFDKKEIHKNGMTYHYTKNEQGHWVLEYKEEDKKE